MQKDVSYLIRPSKLKSWYQKGFVVPLGVSLSLKADFWQIAQKVIKTNKEVFFLDSVRFQEKTGRYSYLTWKPFRVFKTKNQKKIVERLRILFDPYRGKKWNELPFFTGGAVGYFSYELARAFERLPDYSRDDLKLELITLLFIRHLIVFDHKLGQFYLVTNLIPSQDGKWNDAFGRASRELERLSDDLFRIVFHPAENGEAKLKIYDFHANISKHEFKQMVLRAKKYIEAGDIYQANLSQRFTFQFEGEPESIYERLRKINPSPFSSFIKIGSLKIASSSPERLIRLSGNHCETRPIAGTRPRGATSQDEKKFRRQLMMSPKERAEHIMLVDLERNDLGKVSEPKSVQVNELMTIEQYSHVVHIVSNISGRLKPGKDRFDLLQAVFPGGTITGCPKIRSMEIIEELEPFKRHLYTGSIGYLDFNGDMDLNIVIRSLILKGNKGYLQVGAGVVYDSDPESEYWETLHKGKALIDALSMSQPSLRSCKPRKAEVRQSSARSVRTSSSQ